MVDFKDRLVSLDVFRGITMACMVLVENPGNWNIYHPLRHARWGMVGENGLPVHENFTPTDLIMPFFLFIVGVSVVFALWKKKEDPAKHNEAIRKISRRTITLFALGIIFYTWPSLLGNILYGTAVKVGWMGVLQRIALVYFGSALIFLKWKPRTIAIAGIITLFAYWACTFIPVPGYPEPQFFRQYFTPGNVPSCFPEWVDAKILGFANPSGIISTFPAIVTGLIGVLTGIMIKTAKDSSRIARNMMVYGLIILAAGYTWSFFFPIIKDLWTSSYCLVAGGYSMIVFAMVYWLVDVKMYRWPTPPFIAYGVNCISVYFVSHIVSSTLYVIKTGSGENIISVHEWININWFQTWLSQYNASLVFALITVLFWFIPLWIMYKKRIFIKV